MIKKVVIFLDAGFVKQHDMEVEDNSAYMKEVNKIVDLLTKSKQGVIVYNKPSMGIYKMQNIIGVEFLDPPTDEQSPIGFRLATAK